MKPKVLLALDKFKGTISAFDAAQVVARTISKSNSDLNLLELPISDGGGGALEIILQHGFDSISVDTRDALLRPFQSNYAISKNKEIAFIEMASICGISDIPHLDPYGASSLGLGIAARDAISQGVSKIFISLGGSASTDGGVGFLIGLGAEVLDKDSKTVTPNLTGLKTAALIDCDSISSNIQWTFLTDVDNPLVGPNGAAHIFGAQKGFKVEDLSAADEILSKWADLLEKNSGIDIRDRPGTGAAGGIYAAGLALLGGKMESGALWISDLIQLEKAIAETDIVITGEGSFDSQSLMGKGPGLVVNLARKYGKSIFIIAGRVDQELMARENLNYISLENLAPSTDDAIKNPAKWLGEAAEELAKILH